MKKNALIFGCEGQDGFLLSQYLKEIGYSVYGVSHHRSSSNDYLDCYYNLDLSSLETDSLKKILETIRPTEIYYLAAYHTSSQEYESLGEQELLKSISVNYSSFHKVCALCSMVSANTKIIYTASSLVFSGSGKKVCNENTPTAPECYYSLYKLFSMEAAKFFRRKFGLYVSVAIMFNHESIHRKDKFLSKVIVNQIKDYLSGKINYIKIGNLNSETDWGYAGDYVNALWHILQLKDADDFIVSSGQSHRVEDWFLILQKYIGKDLMSAIKETPHVLGREKPPLIGNNTKLIKTGWNPEVSFEHMVIKLYEESL